MGNQTHPTAIVLEWARRQYPDLVFCVVSYDFKTHDVAAASNTDQSKELLEDAISRFSPVPEKLEVPKDIMPGNVCGKAHYKRARAIS